MGRSDQERSLSAMRRTLLASHQAGHLCEGVAYINRLGRALGTLSIAIGLATSALSARAQAPVTAASGALVEVQDGPDPHAHAHAEEHARAAAASGASIGYVPEEGFRLRSEDGDYVLRLALQLGLKFEPTWVDGDKELNGSIAFARPILRGNLFRPWLAYRVSMELSGDDPYLLDAYVDVQPWDAFGFRFGQQGTLVSRHNSFGPHQLFFPEYAGVATYFWSGRERGLTLFGTVFGERLDYFAGIYSGSPIDEPLNIADNYVAEGRLTVNPLGPVNETELPFAADGKPLPTRLSFTVQGYYGRIRHDPADFNPSNNVLTPQFSIDTQEMGTASADLWFQARRLIVFAECYWRRLQPREGADWFSSLGAWGEVMVGLYEDLIGLGARVNWIDPNRDLDNDQAYEVEGQLAWFIHAPELALKLRYAWLRQKAPSREELGALELPFTPGTTQLLTLQLTLAF